MFETLFELLFVAAVGGLVVGTIDSEVVLIDPAFGGIVGVLVPFAVSEFRSSLVVRVAEVHGNGNDALSADIVECGVDCHVGGVGFGGTGEVGDSLREKDASFGETDELDA